jgi:hypothetical protein
MDLSRPRHRVLAVSLTFAGILNSVLKFPRSSEPRVRGRAALGVVAGGRRDLPGARRLIGRSLARLGAGGVRRCLGVADR